MNSKYEELQFVLNILCDLKSYPDHNKALLDQLIDSTKFRIDTMVPRISRAVARTDA